MQTLETSSTYKKSPYISDGMDEGEIEYEQEAQDPETMRKSQADLEIQIWKKEEELRFREQLGLKERELVQSLSSEWEARDAEREKILKRKLQDFRKLENQVQNLLLDLESRERTVSSAEDELLKKRGDLERESKKKHDEVRDVARRVREECKVEVEKERTKFIELEVAHKASVAEKERMEEKYKQLEQSFLDLRLSLSAYPDKNLEEQLATLKRDLEISEKARKNYKSLYTKVAKELSRLQNTQKAEAEQKVLRERRELESMKLQKFAREDLLRGKSEDDRILHEIKQELSELKHKSFSGKEDKEIAEAVENIDPKTRGEIERLRREKSALLDTGLYSETDLVMGEIDSRISQLINNA